jgi:hypothetical protein
MTQPPGTGTGDDHTGRRRLLDDMTVERHTHTQRPAPEPAPLDAAAAERANRDDLRAVIGALADLLARRP